MFNGSPGHSGPRDFTVKDRRTAPGNRGVAGRWRRLKGLLVRPLGLERRGLWIRLVLVDRRRAPEEEDLSPSLQHLRDELRARLLAHELEGAAQVMRHLAFVHDELGRRGWSGVEDLPGEVLAKARLQAQMLASEEPSPTLGLIIERLQVLQVAAEVRAERKTRLRAQDAAERPEVSEATREEFEATKRTWVDTWPPGLARPDRDTPPEREK